MNVNTGLTPTTVQGFNGLYSRGTVDTCPQDHLTDCFNCIFPGKSQLDIREPVAIQNANMQANTISFFIATLASQPVLLTLSSTGNLRDETNANNLANVAVLGVPPDSMHGLNIFGRTYLTFTLGGQALSGGLLYCYYFSPSVGYFVTTLPGLSYALAPTLASQNPGGNVDIGTHQIAFSYLNEKGFSFSFTTSIYISSSGSWRAKYNC